jgi:cytochrome c biogenesis protein CcdA
MTPLEPVTLSFGAALILGLSFGAGPCNIACLPYLGPVFLNSDGGIRSSWRTMLPFSMGRLSGYALLGSIAGWAGLLVQEWVNHPSTRLVLGAATIAVALALLFRSYRGKSSCSKKTDQQTEQKVSLTDVQKSQTLLPGGLFFMGVGMALNPCAPLTTVIFAAAATASALGGFSLGIGFGLGAVIIPSLIFAFGVAHMGAQIREHLQEWRGTLEKFSVALLLITGTATTLGWLNP